jgi:hypothetical protein
VWDWDLNFELAKQMFCLSHTSSPFCSGYFGDGDLENCLPELASNHDPPDLSLPTSWDYRHEPLVSVLKRTVFNVLSELSSFPH